MDEKNAHRIEALEGIVGYRFQNAALPLTALTHSSYANENGLASYERLEFLGDAILGFAAAEYLYMDGNHPEGELTRLRAALVCEASLASAARRLGIGKLILLGRGERSSHGADRPSLLCDVMEAVIGALYLDGGLCRAKRFIAENILSEASQIELSKDFTDYKTVLQELVQRDGVSVLTYRLVSESGPDHEKVFEMEALINGKPAGSGRGHSKKEAERAAARSAYEALRGGEKK